MFWFWFLFVLLQLGLGTDGSVSRHLFVFLSFFLSFVCLFVFCCFSVASWKRLRPFLSERFAFCWPLRSGGDGSRRRPSRGSGIGLGSSRYGKSRSQSQEGAEAAAESSEESIEVRASNRRSRWRSLLAS